MTFLVGENGWGKSTIVEALAGKLDMDAEGGDTVTTFIQHEAESPLHEALVLTRGARTPSMRYFLRAESFFNVAQHVDANPEALRSYGGRPLHGMSHGESFLTLLLERFQPDGLYLLDDGIEPVAYEDTDHYRLPREFLEAPERYLRQLFA